MHVLFLKQVIKTIIIFSFTLLIVEKVEIFAMHLYDWPHEEAVGALRTIFLSVWYIFRKCEYKCILASPAIHSSRNIAYV